MKKNTLIFAAVGILAVGAAASYCSPYLTMHEMRSAIIKNDAGGFSSHVDFPALRENLRGQMLTIMQRKMGDDPGIKGNGFAALGMMMAMGIMNQMIDTMVTPAGVMTMVSQGKAKLPAPGDMEASNTNQPAASSNTEPKNYSVHYKDWSTVIATTKEGSAEPIAFVFKRDGLWSWKLAGINLPLDRLGTDASQDESAALAASAPSATVPGAKAAGSGLPVFPTALEGHPPFELGQLIYLLMRSPGTSVGWDWAVDSPIVWTDNGFVNTDVSTYRRGLARVNVMGSWSTELKQKKDELGWEVQLFTKAPAKLGPQEINIQPGTDGGDDACFGTRFDNCWFDPRPSLKAAGIDAKPVCEYGPNEANSTHVYRLVASGKAPVLFSWLQSEGSGGASASVSLLLNDDEKMACTPGNP